LCPECTKVITARIFEENRNVAMQKFCGEQGSFRDIVFSDVDLYLRWRNGTLAIASACRIHVEGAKACPDGCGLCGMHTSHTALANVDLTNRCNLTCPVCFRQCQCRGISV
jgi:uncharacterized radical SAM superfamily Fe-S cluster-containing enzyme